MPELCISLPRRSETEGDVASHGVLAGALLVALRGATGSDSATGAYWRSTAPSRAIHLRGRPGDPDHDLDEGYGTFMARHQARLACVVEDWDDAGLSIETMQVYQLRGSWRRGSESPTPAPRSGQP
jgi:hypothetical protein